MKFRPSVLLLAIAAVCVFTTNSCNKKYICHCDLKYTGAPGLPDSTSSEYDITDTKSNAKSKCEAGTQTYTNNSITTNEKCYLY